MFLRHTWVTNGIKKGKNNSSHVSWNRLNFGKLYCCTYITSLLRCLGCLRCLVQEKTELLQSAFKPQSHNVSVSRKHYPFVQWHDYTSAVHFIDLIKEATNRWTVAIIPTRNWSRECMGETRGRRGCGDLIQSCAEHFLPTTPHHTPLLLALPIWLM